MRSQNVVLSHFSQRYPKVPKITTTTTTTTTTTRTTATTTTGRGEEEEEGYKGRICVAFDLMRVDKTSLRLLPHCLPIFRALFPDEEEEEEKGGGEGQGEK